MSLNAYTKNLKILEIIFKQKLNVDQVIGHHPILRIKNNLAVGYQGGLAVTNQQLVPDWRAVEVKAAPMGIPSISGNSRTSVGTYCLE